MATKIVRLTTFLVVGILLGTGLASPVMAQEGPVFVSPTQDFSKVSGWTFHDARHPDTHRGLDLGCALGEPIYASATGTAAIFPWNGRIDAGQSFDNYGNLVILYHESGWETRYAHLSKFQVENGDQVRLGQVIGLCGSTGDSTGPHLHYEIHRQGTPMDPVALVNPDRSFESIAVASFESQNSTPVDDWLEENAVWFLPVVTTLAIVAMLMQLFGSAAILSVIWAGFTGLISLIWGMLAALWRLLVHGLLLKLRGSWIVSSIVSAGLLFLAMCCLATAAIIAERNPMPESSAQAPLTQASGIKAAAQLPSFPITYWNGKVVWFSVPVEVWSAVEDAATKHGCDPYLVVAVAHSESPVFNNISTSYAGAQGVWQFMPGTWQMYKPYPNASPWSIPAAADAACRMINDLGLSSEVSEQDFAVNFNGNGSACWNCGATLSRPESPAVRQAKYAWRLWQQLRLNPKEE